MFKSTFPHKTNKFSIRKQMNAAMNCGVFKLKSEVIAFAFSPTCTMLAFGSWDNTVCLWDVATREQIAVLSGHTNPVCSVVFSPDGTLLASGS